jgi:nucleoside-diphosphate-sugar epimerase
MRDIIHFIKIRITRPFTVNTLGPNEARILYDFIIALYATSLLYIYTYFSRQEVHWIFLSAPFLLLVVNIFLGVYSRLKSAKGKIKIMVLTGSCCVIYSLLIIISKDAFAATLWLFSAMPPLTLARFFLSLPHDRHKNIFVSIMQQRGPILITGGAGYIGSCLAELLLNKGFSVRILDRLMYGRKVISDFEKNSRFELIEGDVTDIERLTRAMKGAWTVVHLAGLVGDAACSIDDTFTRHMNIISTRMVKDVAQSLGISRFIFASSCSVYGLSDKELRETDKLNPLSLYAQTKIDSENELLAASRDDFFVTILRFSTVFGHSRRARFDLVGNLFTAQAMNDGLITVIGPHQLRPFIHVSDLARAIYLSIKTSSSVIQNQIFNVGDQNFNMSILELASIVKKISEEDGRTVSLSVNDQQISDRRNYCVSFEKIQKILNFRAEISVEQGVRDMVNRFKNEEYAHYTEVVYNNAKVTRRTLREFYDPMQMTRLYAPLGKINNK